MRSFRFRFRFGLKLLLLAFTVAAVYVGLHVNRVARQRKALGSIESLGGTVRFDYEYDSQGKLRKNFRTLRPPGPEWLHELIGVDYFRTAINVSFKPLPKSLGFLENHSFGDAEFRQLVEALPHLRGLWLPNTEVTDAGLGHLSRLKRLEFLSLDDTAVGDEGLRNIGQCSHLTVLVLSRTRVTDAGLRHLRQLRKLEEVGLAETDVSDAGVERLLNACGKTLRSLNLESTHTTDALVETLAQLRMLAFLDVQSTKITSEGALRIVDAFPQCWLMHPNVQANPAARPKAIPSR